MTSLEGIPILGRGLDWTNGFNQHVLGASSLLGPGDAEMKDGEVGQLERRREGETGQGAVRRQGVGSPLQLGRRSLCLVHSRCLGSIC